MTNITKESIYEALLPSSIAKLYNALNENEKRELLSLKALTDEQRINFLKLDQKDIKVILTEFLSKDKNHNHSLNKKEFNDVKVSEDHNKVAFTALDSDKDNKITFAEYIKTILPE